MNCTGPLEIGLGFYNMQTSYVRPRFGSGLYADAVAEAQLAESLGFDSVWIGEHHHSYDGYAPSPLVVASFLAAHTKRLKLGIGVMLLPLHSAERIAEAVAGFNSFASGRLRIAIGAGSWAEEFAAAGVLPSQRGRIIEQALERFLEGDLADAFRDTELWSGQLSRRGIARAGRLGLPMLIGASGVDRLIDVQQQHRAAGGPAGGRRFTIFRDVWVTDDPEMVTRRREEVLESWRMYASHWADPRTFQARPSIAPGGGEAWPDSVPDQDSRRQLLQTRDGLARNMVDSLTVGTPEEIVSSLLPYVQAGVDGIVFRIRWDGTSTERHQECIHALRETVVPSLQAAAASARVAS